MSHYNAFVSAKLKAPTAPTTSWWAVSTREQFAENLRQELPRILRTSYPGATASESLSGLDLAKQQKQAKARHGAFL